MKLKIDITRKCNKISMPLILNSYKPKGTIQKGSALLNQVKGVAPLSLEPGAISDEPKNEDNIIKNDFDLLTYNIK